jgi:hypothetical protein
MPDRDEFTRLENEVKRIAASTFYKGERAIVLRFVDGKCGSFNLAVPGQSGLRLGGDLPKQRVL